MLIKDKKFYRSFLMLCLPIVLQNVIALSVNLTDNLMLGRYAESALSGVTADRKSTRLNSSHTS